MYVYEEYFWRIMLFLREVYIEHLTIREIYKYMRYVNALSITEFPPNASRNCRIILSNR